MILKDKKVFVSGGAGVIGDYLVKRLHDEGAVMLVGDLKPRPAGWPSDIQYRQGDLNYITPDEIGAFAPEYFFHLAATFERSTETYEFWDENLRHNVLLSHHLMGCLKDSGSLRRVVFASSYLIYDQKLYTFGGPAAQPVSLREDSAIYPRNLTGAAKLSHEIELDFLNEFRGGAFSSICARIYRSYGKDSRDIISRWTRDLLKGETLTVYNEEGLFDYIYAGDVAEGLVRLAKSDMTGIVNLGTGRARRVSEVIEVLRKRFPEMKSVKAAPDIPFEASQADVGLLRQVTGWSPERNIEDAIPEIIAFEEERNGQTGASATALNVLVTSVSKKVPLLKSVRDSITKLGVPGRIHGADLDPVCLGRYFVDSFWEMPRLTEIEASDIVEYCMENEITCIIPTRDAELAFFAAGLEVFREAGINVMVSPPSAVATCLDKLLFHERLAGMGFPAIDTAEDICRIGCESFVVKERFGAGSRGLGLNLSAREASAHASELTEPIFQPFITGQEISVDLYVAADGKVKGVIARTRDLVVNGESQVTTTIRDGRIEKMCCDIAEGLGIYGHAVMQVIVSPDGGAHIVECNCRFGGASSLSVAAGLDSFYWFLLESAGADISAYPFARPRQEKRQVRYPADLVLDGTGI
ncbi:MAG: ATP-grasp domain-containing protein [Nitrospirae bacterium]|nr:ATP-grasp domain-containing protein [Nitrospirota bacterium]MBI5694778.1 ATP-grasp domain-containing protein [Nitrospirota bacterium]